MEILIFKADNVHAEETISARDCFKAGDIFRVFQDGACPEAPAPNSLFYLIKCPVWDFDDASRVSRLDERGLIRRRRRFVDINSLSNQARNALLNNRQATILTRLALANAIFVRDPNAYVGD